MKNTLNIIAFLLFCSALFSQTGCPVFQPGSPGSPNAFVSFYTQNGTFVSTCHCQLTGNELKCGSCTPASGTWYYYTVSINGQLLNCYNPVVLGVEWDFFKGSMEGETIRLDWGTLTETNNKRFNIERSSDGQSVEQIGWIEGAGNSTSQIEYVYFDNSPSKLFPYYRIVQEDYDGKLSASSWIMAYDSQYEAILPIVPNPTKGSFSVHVKRYWGSTEVAIYDITGRAMHKQPVDVGDNNIVTDLPAGKYFVVINGEQQTIRAELAIF